MSVFSLVYNLPPILTRVHTCTTEQENQKKDKQKGMKQPY